MLIEQLGHILMLGRIVTASKNVIAIKTIGFSSEKTQMRLHLGACTVHKTVHQLYFLNSSTLQLQFAQEQGIELVGSFGSDSGCLWNVGKRNSLSPLRWLICSRMGFVWSIPILILIPIPIPIQIPMQLQLQLHLQSQFQLHLQLHLGFWRWTFNQVKLRHIETECEDCVVTWAVQSLHLSTMRTSFEVWLVYNAFKWIVMSNNLNWRLLRWGLRTRKFNYDVLNHQKLVYLVSNVLSKLLFPTDRKNCKLI